MKRYTSNLIHFVTGEIGLTLVLLALAVGINSIPAQAQDGSWKIDREHSVARLSVGSGANAVEVGVARVSGKVIYDVNDAADPVVNLKIKPEKGQGAEYSEITFKSKNSMLTNDGKVAVIGDLTLTRLERSVTLDPNEGYYGAVYGEPVAHTETREVTILIPAERPAVQSGTTQLAASTTISREYFPELATAVASGNWPSAIVQDEQCAMPAGLPSEDYSGAACTGTTIATKTNAVASGTPALGEGYYGFEPAVVPDGGPVTIALDLKLVNASHAGSMSSMSEVAGN